MGWGRQEIGEERRWVGGWVGGSAPWVLRGCREKALCDDGGFFSFCPPIHLLVHPSLHVCGHGSEDPISSLRPGTGGWVKPRLPVAGTPLCSGLQGWGLDKGRVLRVGQQLWLQRCWLGCPRHWMC